MSGRLCGEFQDSRVSLVTYGTDKRCCNIYLIKIKRRIIHELKVNIKLKHSERLRHDDDDDDLVSVLAFLLPLLCCVLVLFSCCSSSRCCFLCRYVATLSKLALCRCSKRSRLLTEAAGGDSETENVPALVGRVNSTGNGAARSCDSAGYLCLEGAVGRRE